MIEFNPVSEPRANGSRGYVDIFLSFFVRWSLRRPAALSLYSAITTKRAGTVSEQNGQSYDWDFRSHCKWDDVHEGLDILRAGISFLSWELISKQSKLNA